jgi:hypothetical protein
MNDQHVLNISPPRLRWGKLLKDLLEMIKGQKQHRGLPMSNGPTPKRPTKFAKCLVNIAPQLWPEIPVISTKKTPVIK